MTIRPNILILQHPGRAVGIPVLLMGITALLFFMQRFIRHSFSGNPFDWSDELIFSGITFMSMSLFIPFISLAIRIVPLQKNVLLKKVAAHLLFSVGFAVLHLLFLATINILFFNSYDHSFGKLSQKIFLNFFHIQVICYWVILGLLSGVRKAVSSPTMHNNGTGQLTIRAEGISIALAQNDIQLIQSSDHYLKVYDGQRFRITRDTLKQVRLRLNKDFIQINRGIIVNRLWIDHVKPASNGRYKLHMQNGIVVCSSKKYKASLQQLITSMPLTTN